MGSTRPADEATVGRGRARPSLIDAATTPVEIVLAQLESRRDGLSSAEAAVRRQAFGPNAVRTHHAQSWTVLARQFRSPLLALLLVAAAASFSVGERSDAVIIGVIVAGSVALGSSTSSGPSAPPRSSIRSFATGQPFAVMGAGPHATWSSSCQGI